MLQNMKGHQVIGSVEEAIDKPVEAFRGKGHFNKSHVITAGTGNFKNRIDISWIKAASDQYKISSDVSDYVLNDIPIVTVDIPNRNLQGFPFEEISSFNPMVGRLVFQTFIGKPLFVEHDNQDWTKSRGIIVDASMKFVPSYKIWKINILAGWDRTKDRQLVKGILKGTNKYYSMGAMVKTFIDSIDGTVVTPDDRRGDVVNGKLRWHICTGAEFFETSNVGDPADPTAGSSQEETWSLAVDKK